MPCKRVEQIASAEFTSTGRIHSNEDEMSSVSGDDETIADIDAVPADVSSTADDTTPVDGA